MSLCNPRFIFILLISLTLFSACSSLPKMQIAQPDWQIDGKLGIRTADQAGSVLFNWQQKQANYVIHLMSPVGQALLNLVASDKQVVAVTRDGKVYRADNAQQLLLNLTGWYFPISDVRYWLQGQNQNASYQTVYNEQQQLSQVTTPDWQVALSRYQSVDGHLLPHLIRLHNRQQDLNLTVVIKKHAYFTP